MKCPFKIRVREAQVLFFQWGLSKMFTQERSNTWSSEVCKDKTNNTHTHTETLISKSHRKPQTQIRKTWKLDAVQACKFFIFYYSNTVLSLPHCSVIVWFKALQNERKPDIYKNLSVQTSFFYTTLLKYSKGMHTNKLWYVKKTTHFLSRSIYVHMVERIHHFCFLVQFTLKQRDVLT